MKYKIIALFVLLSILCNGQKMNIQQLAEKVNNGLVQYNKLPFYDEECSLKEYQLKLTDVNSYFRDGGDTIANTGSGSDSADSYILREYFHGQICSNLKKLLSHSDIGKYDLTKLLTGFNIVHSTDKRLYSISYAAKSRGSYYKMINFMHYRGIDSVQNNFQYNFEEDGYYSIETLNTNEGIKYLLFSAVRGCNYCFSESVSLIKYVNGDFNEEFSTGIQSRKWNKKIEYNLQDTSLTMIYQRDDLNSGCSCDVEANNPDEKSNDESESESNVENQICKYIYKFDGKTFKLYKHEMIFDILNME